MPAQRKRATDNNIKQTSIAIPGDLWNKIDRRVRNSRGQFASISQYIRWIAEQELERYERTEYPSYREQSMHVEDRPDDQIKPASEKHRKPKNPPDTKN